MVLFSTLSITSINGYYLKSTSPFKGIKLFKRKPTTQGKITAKQSLNTKRPEK
jgi:hypothetical protein